MERPGRVVNSASGSVTGNVIQVGSVDEMNLWSGRPAPTGPPAQCPPAPTVFVDRTDELGGLHERRRARRVSLVVVDGGPGTGKSALGRRWAAEVREFYPDGQLYADLRPHRRGGGVEVRAVVEGFLRGLGVPQEWIPQDVAHQDAMLRTLLRDKELLILVDHVTTAAQVLSWLPDAPGVSVVVTSHHRLDELDQHDAVRVRVNPLTVEDGLALLAGYCGPTRLGAEPDRAAELVGLCGGLPVALTVVGARLRLRPALTFDRVVSELSRAVDRFELLVGETGLVVKAVFDGACGDLPDDAARLYRLLGLPRTGEMPLAAVVALAGGTAASVERQLEVLMRANLVDLDTDDVIHVTELVALHAGGKADAELSQAERAEASLRLVRFYLRRAEEADRVAMGDRLRLPDPPEAPDLPDPSDPSEAAGNGFDSVEAAMDWLEAERHNLRAVVDLAAEHGGFDEVWRLCQALWPLFLNRKHYRDWVATHRRGVDAARAVGDPVVEARMRSQLARALIELRRFDEAEAELRIAADAARLGGNRRVEASVEEFTGRLYLDRGAYDRAVEHYTRALEINLELHRHRGAALQRHFLGQALRRSGDLDGARAQLNQALATMDGLGDRRNSARIMMSLAAVLRDQGHRDDAVTLLRRALPVLREHRAVFFVAQVLEQLAELDDDRVQTRANLVEALGIYEVTGRPEADRLRERLNAGD